MTHGLNLVLVSIAITSLPLIAHILWNGLFATWHLPNLALHYLALLSLIQVFFLSLGGILLSLVTTVMIRKRRSQT